MTPSALLLAAFSSGQAPAVPQPMPSAINPVQATAPAPLPTAMPVPNGAVLPSAPAVLGPTAAPITPGFSPAQVSPGAATRIAPELERSITSDQAAEPAEEEEKFLIMRALEGTSMGTLMAERRLSVSGWSQFSYTWSTTDVSNSPVVWNDRADKLMMNQTWLRLDKAVDTEADHATFGYRVDFLTGTDYRFTRQIGLFPDQNGLYGVDMPSFYVNAYLPNVFKGTDVRYGRLFTPFGVESLEAVSTPFVTRSYAFNWCPPFTHNGLQISPQFTDKLSGKFMIANGNDIWYVDGQELRFVGVLSYAVSDDTAVSFGTSLGRGKFNDQAQPVLGGVNNINVFDFVLTHNFSDKLSYAFEYIYGYQNNSPLPTAGGAPGTANWYSFVNYLYYNHTDKLQSVARLEFFEDEQGYRTGFNGLYTAITYGLQWTPCPDLIVRPQIRYDYNNTSTPWEGKDDIWTGAIEWIIRY